MKKILKHIVLGIMMVLIISIYNSNRCYADVSEDNTNEDGEYYTIDGQHVYVSWEWIEKEIALPYYYDEEGDELDTFISINRYGEKEIYWKKKSQPIPNSDIEFTNGYEGEGFYRSDVVGGTIIVPECPYRDFTGMHYDNAVGYKFSHWNAEDGRKYYPGDELVVPYGGMILYCHFTPVFENYDVQISFEVPSCTDEVKTMTVTTNQKITIPECDYTLEGNKFSCWYDGLFEYYPGDEYTVPFKDVTFTALWTPIDDDEYLPGDMNGDGEVDGNDVIYLLYNTLLGNTRYPLAISGDVNGDGELDGNDVIYLLYNTLLGSERYPLYQ